MMYLRDLVWLVISYFGFLRRSEAVALNVSDLTIKVDDPAYVGLFLRRSKTDPLARSAYRQRDTGSIGMAFS